MANLTVLLPTGGRIEIQSDTHGLAEVQRLLERGIQEPLPPAAEIFVDGQTLGVLYTPTGRGSEKPMLITFGASRMALFIASIRQVFPQYFNALEAQIQ